MADRRAPIDKTYGFRSVGLAKVDGVTVKQNLMVTAFQMAGGDPTPARRD